MRLFPFALAHAAFVAGFLLGGCGSPNDEADFQEVDVGWTSAASLAPFRLLFPGESGFAEKPTSMVLNVSGCRSGYVKVHDTAVAGTRLSLLKGDRNCVAALRSFVWRGARWSREGGGDFSGSGSAVFVDTISGKRAFVENSEILSSPLSSTSRVVFRLHEVTAGGDRQLLVPGARATLTSAKGSVAGPFLGWFAGPQEVLLTSVSAAPALRGTFRVKLQCQGTFTARTPLKSSTCKVGSVTQRLKDYYLRLVPDIYSDGVNLTPAIAQGLFGSSSPPHGTGVVSVTLDSQVFRTVGNAPGGIVVDLTTDSSLLSCRKYLLMVVRTNSLPSRWSFTSFNLDFATTPGVCP